MATAVYAAWDAGFLVNPVTPTPAPRPTLILTAAEADLFVAALGGLLDRAASETLACATSSKTTTSPTEQAEILRLAALPKADPFADRSLEGPQVVAVLFDKPTLRTQASFSTRQSPTLGYPMIIDGKLAQVGKAESIADTARILGRQAVAVVWRTYAQADRGDGRPCRGVPVVNALTDDYHPCQILADLR